MTEKNKSIFDRLKLRERLDRRILEPYGEILYHIFQVVYEVDAEVTWERIFRFSPDSNFVTISGNAIVPEGTVLSAERILTQPIEIYPSLTFPLAMLDDESSAYDIAEAVKSQDVWCYGRP